MAETKVILRKKTASLNQSTIVKYACLDLKYVPKYIQHDINKYIYKEQNHAFKCTKQSKLYPS